jgi:hypothetical protein
MSNETDGFLDDGAREGANGARFDEVGDSVKGEIVDKFVIDYVPFGKKEPEIDERTGEPVKQLVVVLQTEYRNWEDFPKNKIPKDADGVALPGDKDTGRRAIYARKGTNIYSALAKAVAAALPAGEKPGKHPLVGGQIGMQFFEDEDTGKGNNLKKFRGKYVPPAAKAESDDFFEAPASKTQAQKDTDADAAKVSDEAPAAKKSVADEEPPF